MPISQKDIKVLWGRAASRCAFPECRVKLTQDKNVANESILIGEQAHIVAEEQEGPRGRSVLSLAERNSYHNLILLCPNHHTVIDKAPEDYPVEKLHFLKSQHELWVDETLSETKDLRKLAYDTIYANLIDAVVEDCRLLDWDFWSQEALHLDAKWGMDEPNRIFEFRQKIIRAAWPHTLPELERAITTVSLAIHEAVETFLQHSEVDFKRKVYRTHKFYKTDYDKDRYDYLLDEYNNWVEECDNYMYEVAKALNWFADVVRRDINPSFFATEGKFLITFMSGLTVKTRLLEYSDDEKASMPQKLTDDINKRKRKSNV